MPRRWSFVFILCSFAYLLVMAFVVREYFVDDAFIAFRYISNFVSGYGFVFNPPVRLEGTTNTGWLLLLTPFSVFFEITTVAKTMGIVLVAGTIVLLYLISRQIIQNISEYILWLPLPLFVVTHYDYLYFSLAGMETALLSFLLCLILYLSLINRYRLIRSLLASFAFLVHPECVLIYPLALSVESRLNISSWKKEMAPIAVFVAAISSYTLLRYFYYGDIMPNTFYAKFPVPKYIVGMMFGLFNSLNANIPAPFNGLLIVLVLFFGAKAFWNTFRVPTIYMISIVAVGMFFCIYSEPDWTKQGRYFAPYVPVAFILFWKGVIEIHKKLFDGLLCNKRVVQLMGVYAIILVLSNIVTNYRNLMPSRVNSYPGYVLTSRELIKPSLWIRDNVEDNAVIATRRIGALSYYSGKNVFDYKYGLTNRNVAKLARKSKRHFNLPIDPALEGIWREIAPDYILEESDIIEAIIRETKGSKENFEVHGLNYEVVKSFPIGTSRWILCKIIRS